MMTPVFNFLNKVWILIRDNTQLENVWANFLGGLSLVVFLFLWNEILRPKRNLTGEWDVTNTITSTEYGKYNNLKVVWRIHFLQNGNLITGSGEKIKDISADGTEFIYEPAKRDNVEIQGYVERNFLRKSRVFINVIQVGRARRSRATYLLKRKSSKNLSGTFITTAGKSRGNSSFIKND